MQVEIALLADYAAVTEHKKLVVCGLFDSIGTLDLPAKHTRMYLAVKARVYGGEEDQHKLMVRLVDPDGADLIPALDATLSVKRDNPSADVVQHLVLQMDNVELKRPGPHSFDIYVDGQFSERVCFEVIQIRPSGPA
ncbi:MAG: hypothetical protein JW820_18720 [Spirochaetales bacterium]|nr:hypothetical protein [Spirochaetales bacterium]